MDFERPAHTTRTPLSIEPMPALRQPSHLALRLLLVGLVLTAWWWSRFSQAEGEATSQFAGDVATTLGSGHAWSELLPRAARTLGLVLGASALATTLGLALGLIISRCGLIVIHATAWIARALSFVPVVGIGWLIIAWLVNDAKLPIESLIPYTPPQHRDTASLALSRTLWAWLVPLWVLAAPMLGQWLAAVVRSLALAEPAREALASRAAGLPPAMLARQGFAFAWTELRRHWLASTLHGLALTLWVEDLFGLPGWGAFTANAIRLGLPEDIEASLLTGSILVAVLAWIGHWLRGSDAPDASAAEAAVQAPPRSLFGSVTVLGSLTLALLAALCLQPEPPPWMATWLLPWLTSLLPDAWQRPVLDHAPALLTDLHHAGIAASWAALTTVVLGTGAALLAQVRALPRLRVLDTLAWWPALILATILGSPAWMGVCLGLAMACHWRDLIIAHHHSGYAQAAKALGLPRWLRWLRHIVMPALQALAAWTLRATATALIWTVLSDYLHGTPSGIGQHLVNARSTVLADPGSAFWPAILAMAAALVLQGLAQVVRSESLDSSLKFPPPRL